MEAQLEAGLALVAEQPACIRADFSHAGEGSFMITKDGRGEACIFDLSKPAVFTEIISNRPLQVRGNHVHMDCQESFNILAGKLELYLLCDCGDKHVYYRTLDQGDAVKIAPGIAHAIFTLEETQFAAFFDADPRSDRQRVPVLVFPN